jgi:hypothetical protein
MIDWIKRVLRALGHLLAAVWGFITRFFAVADRIELRVKRFAENVDALIANIEEEVDHFRKFKFNPQWKNRVINVPIAIEQIKDFILVVPEEIKDKGKEINDDLKALFGLFEHGPPGSGGPPDAAVGGLGKCISWISLIDQIFTVLEDGVIKMRVVVDDIRQLREQIEGLDAFFLQQGNTRVWEDRHLRSRVRR